MGNIMKINMYVKMKKGENTKLSLKTIEEIISRYKSWLKKTNREDRIENYKKFIQTQ
ncbi:hypothetical protein [Clostridium sp. DL-VIII]|uniref:hypothetical protein n=1 Tax=Clostridium sp. DL-VIII TaxID=641107 RepID=UPI00030C4CD1|nr:hypothetical protein [Clostridium sp. DL-VIII]